MCCSVCEESYLQLPQGVVTLLLSCCLLGTECDQLVNTLRHCPETHTHPLLLARMSSTFVSFLLLHCRPITVMDSHSTQEGWVRPEFAFCLVEHRQALAKASIFLIRHREISQALGPLGLAAQLFTGGRRGTPSRQMWLRNSDSEGDILKQIQSLDLEFICTGKFCAVI